MNSKKLLRLQLVHRVMDRQISQKNAAIQLELSDRQMRRLIAQFREHGEAGLISKKRGQPSNQRIPEADLSSALNLIRMHDADFGPTLVTEKLDERHGIKLSVETVRQAMISSGNWTPKRLPKKHLHRE